MSMIVVENGRRPWIIVGWRLVFGLQALAFVATFPVNRFTWQGFDRVHSPLVSNASPHESLRDAIPHLLCMAFWGASVYAEYTMLGTRAFDVEYWLAAEDVAVVQASFGLSAASFLNLPP